MTPTELIRQCGNPEYTIRVENQEPVQNALSFSLMSSSEVADHFIGGVFVRIRNQDGAELDRVPATNLQIRDAMARGARDERTQLKNVVAVWTISYPTPDHIQYETTIPYVTVTGVVDF